MFRTTRYLCLSWITLLCVGSPVTYAMGSTPVTSFSTVSFVETERWPVSFSEEGVHVTVSPDIPDAVSHALTLYSPAQNTIIVADKILIKGVNRYLTDVFVNNTKVALRKDGRFFYEVSLPKIGENLVWVSLISPDFKVTAIPLRVVRLKALEGESPVTSNYVLLANSPYVAQTAKWTLKTAVTRETLADAIFAYQKDLTDAKTFPTDSKSPKVAQVLGAGLMTSYPDGSFKPEQTVKLVDYIVGIVRLLKLSPKNYEKVALPYQDVAKDHWTTPYIQALYGEGLLPSGTQLQLGQPLTFQTFADLWILLPGVQSNLQASYAAKKSAISQDAMRTAVSATVLQVHALRTEIAKTRRLELGFPAEGAVVSQPELVLRGRVFPPETIKLNQKPLVPSADGSFSVSVSLAQPGTHAMRLDASFATLVRTVTYTPGYADMTGHWAAHTAAKFAQLGWRFDNGPDFLPRQYVTRLELARVLNQIFKPASSANFDLKDVAENDRAVVASVLSEGFMSLHQGLFVGQNPASKAEVAIVLQRALGLPKAAPVALFSDVPATHWAVSEIAALVSANMITAGGYFAPSRAITRAELVALLAKVPAVKSKIDAPIL